MRGPIIMKLVGFGDGEYYAVLRQEGVEILTEGWNKIMTRKKERNKEEIKVRRKVRIKEGRKVEGTERKRKIKGEMSKKK
jgi:hypothetical protein